MMRDDIELLGRYAGERDEGAFGEVVRRHLPLVYGTALRKLRGDEASARDVAQVVFSDLARKAGSLAGQRSLEGWLHKSTCFAASKFVRTEERRRRREEEAMNMAGNVNEVANRWQELAPNLDDALNELNEEDREAVMLRYFRGQKFAEVGSRLGVSENTARMRVERAVEKVRGILASRGATVTGGTVLLALEQAPSAVILPAGMAGAVTGAALAAGSLGTELIVAGAATAGVGAPAFWTMGKALGGAALICGLGTWMYLEKQEKSRLRGELAQAQAAAVDMEGLRAENRRLASRQISPEELARYRDDRLDALRLRNRVALMQGELNELKKRMAEAPKPQMPEPNGERAAWDLNERRKVGDFHNVGRSTPEAACETVLWASLNNPQELAGMIYLPETIQGMPREALDGRTLAPMLHRYQHLGTNGPVTEVWLEKRTKADLTVRHADSTNYYDDIISFQVTGADALGNDTGRHIDMRFAPFEDGWKLLFPGLSPNIRKERR